MQDTQPTLLLTRPKAQSIAFLSECEKHASRKLPVVISPIMRIEARGDVPDLSPYESLIFTSAHGVAACSDKLRDRQVFTVGVKTCELALQAGARARTLGEDMNAFLEQAENIVGPALHCRGAHTRGDLMAQLNAKGITADEAILYDQIAQPLSPAAIDLLQSKALVVAPLFSPRSARLLCENPMRAEMRVIAMSEAVAQAWTGPGTKDTISTPTSENMVLRTVRHF